MTDRFGRVWPGRLLLAGGLLMFAGGVAHTFAGWPAIAAELDRARVDDDLAGALQVGWHFGGLAMNALGLIVVLCWLELRTGTSGEAGRIAMVAGLLYLLFGAGAFLVRFPNPHFLPFAAVGAAVVIGACAGRRPAAAAPEP